MNPDLWAPLLEESEKHVIHYHWLKGHAGHPENERCDRLAVEQSKNTAESRPDALRTADTGGYYGRSTGF